ncbi:antitoxin [Streptomyces collinus]|uniref:Kanamycin biosynthetic protein n=1 Tax=Streptomyces collinus (strain DSM 40733 / Tue 365) TaxID=1214242 RepID=S5V0T9_STRC3|nr:antitoxin [Streptomyces collinus]AGS73198.1 kanamycin biosynthetic protein [Streptomyces collinus Tu 365]UJA11864.1 antitoxin [Streptomyces collinus]UJA13270.1 antitoxin [Streptomyces collinus]
MSFMDKIKGMLKGHEDMADKGIDKGGDYVDQRTGDKYRSQVDTGQDKLRDEFGTRPQGPDNPPRP